MRPHHFKKRNILIALMVFGIPFSCKDKFGDKMGTGEVPHPNVKTYVNPMLDVNFPDATVIKAPDGFYYAYATNTPDKNIQVLKSQNLVDWEDAGDTLPQKPIWADKDFWAQHILYVASNQTYYLYSSGESLSEDLGKGFGVAAATSPTGSFVDKGEPLLCGESFINIAPMAFDDSKTGKKLLYWGSGHEAIKVRELSDDCLSFKEESEPIEVIPAIVNGDLYNYQNLVEGAWVTNRNNYYCIYFSGDNCCGERTHYAVMIARSTYAKGPFENLSEATGKENNVILERQGRWNAPGHNSVITDDAGQKWMVYHAINSLEKEKGRVMLMDKISYENGWPTIEKEVPSMYHQEYPKTKHN